MADRLGISRPAVSQMAAGMHKKGFITYERDSEDGRRRQISLTGSGRETVRALQPLWDDVSNVTAGIIDSHGIDLLSGLAGLEDALDELSLSERIGNEERSRK
jgi:DNA-binding MarR family transcriptional regulator